MPSVIATFAAMIGGPGLLAGTIALVMPAFVDQFDELGQAAREGLDEALAWRTQGPLGGEREQIDRAVETALQRVQENSAQFSRGLLSGAILVVELVAGILLAVVLVFFLVHDGRGMWAWAVGLFPGGWRADVEAIGLRVWIALSA
ncbi:MAG: AI-2E family transporter [Solirubrobacteraceae bacterium]